ncbi:hypothetical protein M2352_003481 [Azospirillum fermentarium]|uniref:hypothetical protein n=1 Tax=Azospirillum fermentarium TaxID=1233114 RepID=UPI0022275739|nr:hypothetical protein [Azospirillum fermentarium]MCW2247847.1 hypothetical protein [Azospirillum fermentarium]
MFPGRSIAAAALVCLAIPASSAKAQQADKAGQTDVIGLQLGMSRADIEKTLRAHNPEFKFKEQAQDIVLPNGRPALDAATGEPRKFLTYLIAEFHAGGDNPYWKPIRELVITAFAGEPGKEVAGSISRAVAFEPGQEPPTATVADGLKAKYGAKPTGYLDAKTAHEYSWYFDTRGRYQEGNGKSSSIEPVIGGCTIYRVYNNFAIDAKVGVRIAPATNDRENCGQLVSAKIVARDDNPGIAAGLGVFLSNEKYFHEGLIARKAYIAALQAGAQAKDAEAAKQRGQGVKF